MGSLPVISPRKKDGEVEQFTLKIQGKPFYCKCKCNVFHKPDNTNSALYKCNSCGAEFEATYKRRIQWQLTWTNTIGGRRGMTI